MMLSYYFLCSLSAMKTANSSLYLAAQAHLQIKENLGVMHL